MKRYILLILLLLTVLSLDLKGERPYVILVSLDGFRWDYPDRGVSPNLDNLAMDGVRALTLKPVFPSKTFPNHLSIITGLYPENHGIIANYFYNPENDSIYSLSNKQAVREGYWYQGEPFWQTAQRHGIKCASYFWPSSEAKPAYRQPEYFMDYDHDTPYEERVNGVIDWLSLPYNKRPHFITLYFHETDSKGHEYGPDSRETNEGIMLVDSMIGILRNKIKDIGLQDSVNIIVLSDHGMTYVDPDHSINIEIMLSDFNDYRIIGTGPVMMIFPREDEVLEMYEKIKSNENNFNVYLKKAIPDRYHYSTHPFIAPIVLIAANGWYLADNHYEERRKEYDSPLIGHHGYDNELLDMHGIFIASGPAFKAGYRTGTLQNIDIYPLLCEIFGIEQPDDIDGDIERIRAVLKE